MRIHRVLSLLLGFAVSSCDGNEGPAAEGTLVVTTATEGTDPDPDGYLLTVGEATSVALAPTGTVRIDTPSGSHLLRLLGVADHCVVAPGVSLEVVVPAHSTTPVSFEVSCQATGARITVVTTGADFDRDGYRLVVDGTDRGVIPANGTVLTRLASGSRTIVLQGLATNCSLDGQGSQTVTIQESEVVPIEFAVVCTATTGMIAVLLSAVAEAGEYAARLDGGTPLPVVPDMPAYLANVTPGIHDVSLTAPGHCTVERPSQSVTVTAGSPVRDTVEVTFSAICEPTQFRISAPTTGPIPDGGYIVVSCDTGWYCYYNGPSFLGTLAPNGVLMAPAVPGLGYYLELRNIPANCRVQVPNPTDVLTLTGGEVLDVEFPVACSP